jgi:hypothetical protein
VNKVCALPERVRPPHKRPRRWKRSQSMNRKVPLRRASVHYAWYQWMLKTCSSEEKLIGRGSRRLVMHTTWKTRGVPWVSCSHEIYRGLRSLLLGRGANVAQTRRVAGLRRWLDTSFVSRCELRCIHQYVFSAAIKSEIKTCCILKIQYRFSK